MNSLMKLGNLLNSPKNVSLGVMSACMVGRPLITMSNKNISDETKRYTASREFFTEFFNMINTYTLVSGVEKLVPKLVAKKVGLKNLTKEGMELIKNTGREKLPLAEQKVKSSMVLSSFFGTALTVAVITPILNNLLLNKIMDKLPGNKKKGKTEEISKDQTANMFQNFNKVA
jgi:hypothetical protein